jgi:hypothetical protein
MARKYVFVDEAGNFDFTAKGSKYFILASVTLDVCTAGDDLLELRRDLVWEGLELNDAFHATTNQQRVRDRVFTLLSRRDFRVDATVFEKRKTHPTRQTEDAFYELAWYLHMQYVAPQVAASDDELMVVGASVSTKKRRQALGLAVAGVVRQTAKTAVARTAYWPAASDPCLQIADYCCWAIQRKWEQGDDRSHVLIASKIRSEFEVFRKGKAIYY